MEQTKIKTLFKLSENEKAELKKKYFPVKTSVCYFNSGVVLLKSDGTVSYSGNDKNIKSKLNGWNDITQICSGRNHVIGLKSDGTVIAVGDNTYSQCNVENWCYVKEIKSGDYNTIGITVDDKVLFTGICDDGLMVFQKSNDELNFATIETIKKLTEGFIAIKYEFDKVRAELEEYRAESIAALQKVQQLLVATPVSEFEYTVYNDEVIIVKYKGKSEKVVIPSEIGGKKVVHIGSCAFGSYVFSSCQSLKNIEIPSGVTSIGDEAFSYCNSLTSIEIPSSVTMMGKDVFLDCSYLQTIYIKGRKSAPSGWHWNWKFRCNAKIVWDETEK